ncbi:hypothetical protein LOC68_23425 [Blastopirellula sp. JC732]|uniref:Uncharacterized protein n=1 Tax=Blastopirellula sediminis TaxID=2894196 RepID=A0A9X1MR45_9BACT|nr:hypothetical protein [Blastopirellula sediminis]MCC9605344.1 hypothetical protein [Blastopirellula sediminis]MCC9631356.1 hypothetical protein [Blastopirellula sediminis]
MNARQLAARLAWLSLAILIVIVQAAIVEACPTCKAGFGDRQADAYGWSIIFMMAMPFTLVGAFAAYVFWSIRSKASAAMAAGSDEAVAELARRKSASGVPTQPPVDA